MNKFYSTLIVFICILVFTNNACSISHDFQLWVNMVATGPLDKDAKIKYWLEAQERMGEDVSILSQEILRPGIGYSLSPYSSLWGGYAWIYSAPPFARNPFEENRIWQQYLWARSFSQIKWTSRTRLEQRFLPDSNVAWRARELLKVQIPFTEASKLNLAIYDEIFIHLNNFRDMNNRGTDQNRFFIGLNYPLTKTITAELGYLQQNISRIEQENFLGRDISLNVFVSF